MERNNTTALMASTLCIILMVFISLAAVFIIKGNARERSLEQQNEQLMNSLSNERALLKEYVSLSLQGLGVKQGSGDPVLVEDTLNEKSTTSIPRYAAQHGHTAVLHYVLTADKVADHQTDALGKSESLGLRLTQSFDTSLAHIAASSGRQETLVFLIHVAGLLQRGIGVVPGTAEYKKYRAEIIEQIIGSFETSSSDEWKRDVDHISSVISSGKTPETAVSGIPALLGLRRKPIEFSIDLGDRNCRTPLQLAVMNGHLETVKMLVRGTETFTNFQSMRDLELTSPGLDVSDGNSHSDNHPAVRNNRKGPSRKNGNVEHSINPVDIRNLMVVWKRPNAEHRDRFGFTALHLAVNTGSIEMVKLIVEYMRAGSRGSSQKHVASSESTDRSQFEKSGDDSDVRKSMCMRDTDVALTPLHLAARLPDIDSDGQPTNATEIVRFLIESQHAQILALDPQLNLTPFGIALQQGHVETLQAMLPYLAQEATVEITHSSALDEKHEFTDVQRVLVANNANSSFLGQAIVLGSSRILRDMFNIAAPLPNSASDKRKCLETRSRMLNVTNEFGLSSLHLIALTHPDKVDEVLSFVFNPSEFDVNLLNINAPIKCGGNSCHEFDSRFGSSETILDLALHLDRVKTAQILMKYGAIGKRTRANDFESTPKQLRGDEKRISHSTSINDDL